MTAIKRVQKGFRLFQGETLNQIIDEVNDLSGSGTPGPITGTTGTFTGVVTAPNIAGGDATLDIAGLAAAQGGTAALAGGASSTSGNAGGAASVTGGVPGATGVGGAASVVGAAGGTTSGAGGVAGVTGGAGTAGNAAGGVGRVVGGAGQGSAAGGAAQATGGAGGATGAGGAVAVVGGAGGATSGVGGVASLTGGAGSGGNANGGSVVLAGGAKNGTGVAGMVIKRSIELVAQGAPAAKTTSATLTAAEVLTGIITVNQGGAGASAQQLPTAAAMDTAMPDSAAGDAFDFSVVNISVVAAESASLTTNTGWTLVGAMDVPAYSAAGSLNSSGRFRARKTATGAWTLYRLS